MSIVTNLKRAFKGSIVEKVYRGFRKATASESELIAHKEHDDMLLLFAKILRNDSNAVDIGCHMGEMLAEFCSLAPMGRHIAFEPIPSPKG